MIAAQPELGNLALTEAGLAVESGPGQISNYFLLLSAFDLLVLEDKKCISCGAAATTKICGMQGKF